MRRRTRNVLMCTLVAVALIGAAIIDHLPVAAQDGVDAGENPVYLPIVSHPDTPSDYASDPAEESRAPAVVTSPDLIFADGFESGNLNSWSNLRTDGGNLAAAASAKLQQSIGVQVAIPDNDSKSATDTRPVAERRLRVRFYVDPNGIKMASGNVVVLFTGNSSGDARLVQIELGSNGSQYTLRAGILNDANGMQFTSPSAISDAPHAVEIDWIAATSNGANDGSLRIWIDGADKGSVTGIDNNWRPIERVRMGAVLRPSSGTRGTLFLDSYESRRSTYIGLFGETQPAPTTTPAPTPPGTPNPTPTPVPTDPPITEQNAPAVVFVSRQIPNNGTIYWDVPKDMPGVGPHSRFRLASPGKLVVREANGQLRTLVDGGNPTSASLNLIDVNAPDVSYDGKTILFAGIPNGSYSRNPATNPGAWRIYAINADGSGLRQITRSDQSISYSQFGAASGGLQGYDDTDPAWLPDGRIVFSSTRWPSFGHYSGVRTSNLYVVNADGSSLHRITAERNGADRPTVDPITGKIVYARWWRNHRFATNQMDTVAASGGGYVRKDGLTSERNNQVGGYDFFFRNSWHIATINPDGTGLAQWGGPHHHFDTSHAYGGAFLPNGDFIANYFPMSNMTEAAGFGGLRRYPRGPFEPTGVIGVTSLTLNYVHPSDPTSYGVFVGNYASEPALLPDGRLVISWAADVGQDYGLYLIHPDGTGRTLLYDNAGTTELRAKPLIARAKPPVIPDSVNTTASLLPPAANGPYDVDGTFSFKALNVYANGPVDTAIPNAIDIGSASTIRFFTDFQRTSPGSFAALDWPIILATMNVNPDGSVTNPNVPANIPLFEQIRSKDGTVPLKGSGSAGIGAHVAGMNYGRPGEVQRCVGCHAGHTMIAVPANDADAAFSNVAPSASVSVSSSRDGNQNRGLVDRQVMNGEIWRYWTSANGQASGQWVQLTFPVPVTVRSVKLYNPRSGGEANSSLQVAGTTVRLYSDTAATQQVGSQTTGGLAVTGTAVSFPDVKARVVRIDISGMSGTFYGSQVASLAEIEVIGRAEAP